MRSLRVIGENKGMGASCQDSFQPNGTVTDRGLAERPPTWPKTAIAVDSCVLDAQGAVSAIERAWGLFFHAVSA